MLYPLPVVMVSMADKNGKKNIITIAWAGTICTNPPMVSISVRPERYSHAIIKETGEFVINLTTKDLAFATDYCGVKSGRDVDKFKEMGLTALPGKEVAAPIIAESPVSLECRVREIKELGSHDMFIADVVAVHADDKYMDEKHKFHLERHSPSCTPTAHISFAERSWAPSATACEKPSKRTNCSLQAARILL
jgi:flavin reductase (DIM6/NTAB) family NADH-FMN oxidoreductase RutF